MKPKKGTHTPDLVWLSKALALLVIAAGAVNLVGWHSHVPRLTSWVTWTNPMVYNTALSFVLLGGALVSAESWRRLSATLALLGGIPALLTLFQYAAGVSLGIDELLMTAGKSVPHSGRIAPNSALCLVALSVSLLFLQAERGSRRRNVASPLLNSVALALGVVSLAGHSIGFATFGWGRLVPMALPTSVLLALLSIALLSINWRDSTGSDSRIPSWLYLTTTIAGLVVSVSLWHALVAEEHARIRRATAGQLEIVRASLLSDMKFRVAAIERLVRRLERNHKYDARQLEFEVGLTQSAEMNFQMIGLVDPGYTIRWVYPTRRYETMIGVNVGGDAVRRTALEEARASRTTVVTRRINLLSGGEGINACSPIYRNSVFGGFLVAAFRFEDLFRRIVDPTLTPGYAVALYDNGEEIYFRALESDQRGSAWEQQAPVQVANSTWTLKLWPEGSALSTVKSTTSTIVLGAGVVLSLLLGLAVYFAQAARLKERAALLAGKELQEEAVVRRQAEQTLEQFFEVCPDMLCIAGFDGYFKQVNPAWVNHLGWQTEQLLEKPFASFVHPDDIAATEAVMVDLGVGSIVRSFENRFRTRDGSFRWMQWASRGIPGSGLIYARARDVTEEKAQARARLDAELMRRRATEELDQFFTLSLDLLCIVGLDGYMRRVNPAWERALGFTATELLSKPWFDWVHPGDRSRAATGFSALLQGGDVRDLEARFLTKEGGYRWLVATATAALEQGVIFAAVSDITERKILEEQLRSQNVMLAEQNVRLETASRLKSEFLANMSHELRTPLNGVIGFSELLYDGKLGPLADRPKEFIGRIHSSATHLLHLINSVLDLSKVEAGRMVFQPERVVVSEVIREVVGILGAQGAEKQILIQTEIEAGVDEVDTDPGRLKQVLYNYLSNALKFTGEGGRIVVRLRTEGSDDFRLEVADTGIGIDRNDLSRLFVEFQQLDASLAKRHQGTGLGLALTKRIVEAQGGRVGVTSTLGRGSVFFAILPRTRRLDSSAETPINTVKTPI